MLRLADLWTWDFWLADDGRFHHLHFLQAPRGCRRDRTGRRELTAPLAVRWATSTSLTLDPTAWKASSWHR